MIPGSGKITYRREWLPVPVFLPGEFHGQKSPVGYSPWSPNNTLELESQDALPLATRMET